MVRWRAFGLAAGLNGDRDMAKTKTAADAADGELLPDTVAGAEGADTVAADPAPADGADPAPEAEAPMLPPAVCTVGFMGVPDGLVIPREFLPGDVVLGDLGEVALREGWAERKAD
jgi:hypothetical protein